MPPKIAQPVVPQRAPQNSEQLAKSRIAALLACTSDEALEVINDQRVKYKALMQIFVSKYPGSLDLNDNIHPAAVQEVIDEYEMLNERELGNKLRDIHSLCLSAKGIRGAMSSIFEAMTPTYPTDKFLAEAFHSVPDAIADSLLESFKDAFVVDPKLNMVVSDLDMISRALSLAVVYFFPSQQQLSLLSFTTFSECFNEFTAMSEKSFHAQFGVKSYASMLGAYALAVSPANELRVWVPLPNEEQIDPVASKHKAILADYHQKANKEMDQNRMRQTSALSKRRKLNEASGSIGRPQHEIAYRHQQAISQLDTNVAISLLKLDAEYYNPCIKPDVEEYVKKIINSTLDAHKYRIMASVIHISNLSTMTSLIQNYEAMERVWAPVPVSSLPRTI